MKDQITQEIVWATMKSVPAITAAVVVRNNIDWSVVVSNVTMIYTAILAFDIIVRHWGLWAAWLKSRIKELRSLWNWFHGR